MMKTTTDIGRFGEKIARKHLKKSGYKIIETNKHCSHNEIDIIAKDKVYIVFVEVKTRSLSSDLYSNFGSAASAVDKSKQRRLINAAISYLKEKRVNDRSPRFDVIEVYLSRDTGKLLKLNHIENAFGINF